ncbi:uncharacterized protein DNG_02896 [Cephalotrichum gorgonifer]|uniref:Uncharacterized protein n=1 Tax=Cephalotrichum gorgonifer TaxID=2041049 RepID=A0AAE8ST51_9PEZI|nr:uncharacterized protein DNG_02896 [Cephalotrichum gorgonifer]
MPPRFGLGGSKPASTTPDFDSGSGFGNPGFGNSSGGSSGRIGSDSDSGDTPGSGSPSSPNSNRPAPDPGAFGNLIPDNSSGSSPAPPSSSTPPSIGGSSGASASSGSVSGSNGGTNRGGTTTGSGSVQLGPGAIAGICGGVVGVAFLFSIIHFWSRERTRAWAKDEPFRYGQVLWKSVKVITGIMLVTWLYKKMFRSKKDNDADDRQYRKSLADSSSDLGYAAPPGRFEISDGVYKFVPNPACKSPPQRDETQTPQEGVPFILVSPETTPSPSQHSRRRDLGDSEMGESSDFDDARAGVGGVGAGIERTPSPASPSGAVRGPGPEVDPEPETAQAGPRYIAYRPISSHLGYAPVSNDAGHSRP